MRYSITAYVDGQITDEQELFKIQNKINNDLDARIDYEVESMVKNCVIKHKNWKTFSLKQRKILEKKLKKAKFYSETPLFY